MEARLRPADGAHGSCLVRRRRRAGSAVRASRPAGPRPGHLSARRPRRRRRRRRCGVCGRIGPAALALPWVTAALAAAVVALVAWRCLRASPVERRARFASLPAALLVCTTSSPRPGGRMTSRSRSPRRDSPPTCGGGGGRKRRSPGWSSTSATNRGRSASDARADARRSRASARLPRRRLGRRGRPPGLAPVGGRSPTWTNDGGPVAAVVHDRATLSDRELADSVSTAVGLVVANVRMQGEVAARGREVAASRRRLVEAADDERRRLGEDLRMGVDRQLEAIGTRMLALGANPAALRLAEELDAARRELRALAQGIHPNALTEHGLRAALEELAARAALPVWLDVEGGRFQESHEAAAFFVCSEALTNVAKYAHASRVEIAVSRAGTRLLVRVADDGVGGADPARGSRAPRTCRPARCPGWRASSGQPATGGHAAGG